MSEITVEERLKLAKRLYALSPRQCYRVRLRCSDGKTRFPTKRDLDQVRREFPRSLFSASELKKLAEPKVDYYGRDETTVLREDGVDELRRRIRAGEDLWSVYDDFYPIKTHGGLPDRIKPSRNTVLTIAKQEGRNDVRYNQ